MLPGQAEARAVPSVRPARDSAWDACHLGVVLRAVVFVQVVVMVAALFILGPRPTVLGWLDQVQRLTVGALPATLGWLLLGCALQRPLALLPVALQWACGLGLGALAGVGGASLMQAATLLPQPPWLACAAAGALLASVLLAGLMWRMRARLPADTRARLAELQARIRPHFLFNSLNSAIALVRAEPARAEALLEDLCELFRSALADTQQAVTLGDEVELARRYLEIEQVRFGERLRVRWDIDPATLAALLPPLILQPLVENAVRHGVEPRAEGADLIVRSERRGARVVVKVSNTMPAGSGDAGMGLALDNVRERLALLHDLEADFRAGRHGGVYQARLEIPARS